MPPAEAGLKTVRADRGREPDPGPAQTPAHPVLQVKTEDCSRESAGWDQEAPGVGLLAGYSHVSVDGWLNFLTNRGLGNSVSWSPCSG